jgi:transposase InsO family protein
VVKLSRSSFYHKLRDEGQEEMQQEADLRSKIEVICLEYPSYHCGRVTDQLKREGLRVNHKKVLRLMRKGDLLFRVRGWRVKTTDSKHRFPAYPNLMNGMVITCGNQVWVSDIICIRMRTGLVCLAGMLDA